MLAENWAAIDRRQRFAIAVSAVLLATLPALPIAADETRSHNVRQILLDGKPVEEADVTVTRGPTVEHALRRSETIPDGSRIDVPARVTVVVTSSGAKSTITLDPGSSLTFVSTGSGELVSSNGGTATFAIVPGSLDFFRVQSSETLSAAVHGSVFSIDTTENTVTFTCARDAVDITQIGAILLSSVLKRVVGSQQIQRLNADSHSKAIFDSRPGESLWTFATLAEAQDFFEANYAAARSSYENALELYRDVGDLDGQAQGFYNIGLIEIYGDKYQEAEAPMQKSLALFEQLGDGLGQILALTGLGSVQFQQGDFPRALDSYQRAQAINAHVGDSNMEAVIQSDLKLTRRRLLPSENP